MLLNFNHDYFNVKLLCFSFCEYPKYINVIIFAAEVLIYQAHTPFCPPMNVSNLFILM